MSCSGESVGSLPTVDEPLPELVSELGVRRDSFSRLHSAYAPMYPLWTNGSTKDRSIVLPPGTQVDTREEPWVIPVGTYFFKSFAYQGEPVETRVMRLMPEGEWEYAVYVWNGDDATLANIDRSALVPVEGGALEHGIPSRRDCRTCHESNLGTDIIGFRALQLNQGTLDDLSADGIFSDPVTNEELTASSDLERQVLGYFEGNCTHCHHGEAGPNASFDLRYESARANIVGQATESSGAPVGERIVPGAPEESVLRRALTREEEFAMPPLGVQRRDDDAIADLDAWIRMLDR
ncbi:MAG: c-type cytochrome domain-containing protein [Myxococcota bacterium]